MTSTIIGRISPADPDTPSELTPVKRNSFEGSLRNCCVDRGAAQLLRRFAAKRGYRHNLQRIATSRSARVLEDGNLEGLIMLIEL